MARYNKSRPRRLAACLLAAITLLALLPWELTARAEKTVLTVGFSDFNGLSEDGSGGYGGYAADYLEQLARYTGWDYEYRYDTWFNNLNKLESGAIDLLVQMHYTPERADTFLFSQLPMANDYMALYTMADSALCYQDYEAFRDRRVGVVKGTVFEEFLRGYDQAYALDLQLVLYVTEAKARDALERGTVDMIAGSRFSDASELKLLDRYQTEGVYFVTGRHNEALMAQLDQAMQQALADDPDLPVSLDQAHHSTAADLRLTREELEWLQSAGPITVLHTSDRRPLRYTDGSGELVGALVEYLDALAELCGLDFVHVAANSHTLRNNLAALDNDNTAIFFSDQELAALGLDETLHPTDPLIQFALAYVRKTGAPLSEYGAHTFALTQDMSHVRAMLLEANSASTVLFCDTAKACLEAVRDGLADMAILEEHTATYLLQKPSFADALTRVPGGSYYLHSMSLYTTDGDAPLRGVLNKALATLTSEQRANIVANAMLHHAYTYEPEDILYEYLEIICVAVTALAVILLLASMLYRHIDGLRRQRKETQRLEELMRRDELTGVYNRAGFLRMAEQLIAAGGEDLLVVRVNIRNFKVINELFGTDRGDRLLRETGRTLEELSRGREMVVGRFTADHFYLCLRQRDLDAIDLQGRGFVSWLDMHIIANYGVFPVAGQKDLPVSAMCDRADMALTGAASAGESPHIFRYSDAARQQLLREQAIERDMEQALAQRQFRVFLQPKYDVHSEQIVGAEALVRWFHPDRGMVPPGEFIGLFERNGFIRRLDHYIWEESCRFMAQAREKGLACPPVSINVSRIHFYGTGLQEKLLKLVEAYGLSPADLELEVTESMYADEPEMVIGICDDLRRAGFRIAMDDFGSGYSSLNMLKELPLDIIKMDLRFLSGESDPAQREKGRSILGNLIRLARDLRLQVVVEGLETQDQRDFVRSTGPCIAQGYFYSRPIDCGSFEALLPRAADREA